MERTTEEIAIKLFGNNFIGKNELQPFFDRLNGVIPHLEIPPIHFSIELLTRCAKDYILILGLNEIKPNTPMNIFNLYNIFPATNKITPHFYNQDWYLNDQFVKTPIDYKWHLIQKYPNNSTRKKTPSLILKENICINFPTAIFCTYTFFAWYFIRNEILWEHDFIWCSDNDSNGDQIYVGRYSDPLGINNSGFSIHRHLKIKDNYTAINVY